MGFERPLRCLYVCQMRNELSSAQPKRSISMLSTNVLEMFEEYIIDPPLESSEHRLAHTSSGGCVFGTECLCSKVDACTYETSTRSI